MTETLTIADMQGDPFRADEVVGLQIRSGEGKVFLEFWLRGEQVCMSMPCEDAAMMSMELLQSALEADDE